MGQNGCTIAGSHCSLFVLCLHSRCPLVLFRPQTLFVDSCLFSWIPLCLLSLSVTSVSKAESWDVGPVVAACGRAVYTFGGEPGMLGALLARSLLLGGRSGSLKSRGSQQTLLNPGLRALSDVRPNLLELEALEIENSQIRLPKKVWLDLGT